ncbi:MAG: MFS superfamily sulfate permease-like transporter [Salibacteraceae bacterium]|jgi:MFS superfamily sulfate permease-like transporter
MNNNSNPLKNFKDDIPASIVVFLVAMPLCLGIALASGAPLFTGLISGIIGGIVVGSLSGSALGVSGPAAGLATIVAASIIELGGFEIFLVAVILAGVIQLIMGFVKAGIIAYYFPSSVIHGMLAGIGIIIFLKQIPHAFGYDKDPEGEQEFLQSDGHNTFDELWYMLEGISPGVVVISLVSLAILIIWETKLFKSLKFTKIVPGPLVAVVTGVVLAIVFQGIPSLMVISEHMVSIPMSSSVNGFFENFTLPDFTALANPKVYITAIIIALVASLETLLSVEAADKLDSLKRVTPTNRELKAQGVGNIIAGFIGGLPVTQVIVRSSANSQSGGKTKASTIIHGILMLVSIIAIPSILNKIPLGVLAAILFVVGYKLAKPALFIKMYKQGLGQFIPFLVTVVGIIFSNLLIGIALGLVVAIFIILRNNFKVPYLKKNEKSDGKGVLRVILSEDVTFLNKASIQKLLADIPDDSQVIVDARANRFIHHDVIEIIEDFQISAVARNIEVEVRDLFTDKIYEPKQQFELTNIKE